MLVLFTSYPRDAILVGGLISPRIIQYGILVLLQVIHFFRISPQPPALPSHKAMREAVRYALARPALHNHSASNVNPRKAPTIIQAVCLVTFQKDRSYSPLKPVSCFMLSP